MLFSLFFPVTSLLCPCSELARESRKVHGIKVLYVYGHRKRRISPVFFPVSRDLGPLSLPVNVEYQAEPAGRENPRSVDVIRSAKSPAQSPWSSLRAYRLRRTF